MKDAVTASLQFLFQPGRQKLLVDELLSLNSTQMESSSSATWGNGGNPLQRLWSARWTTDAPWHDQSVEVGQIKAGDMATA